MPGPDQLTAPQPTLWWTPWPGTGPAFDVLGDIEGCHLIELGCGRGDNAAACAAAGAVVVGVDIDPDKVQDARTRWGRQPRLRFHRAEAGAYLRRQQHTFDIICSIFGALSYDPAGPLLELITRRLRPGGTLAFSARLPPTTPYATSPGHGGWIAHALDPRQWAATLRQHGLTITSSTCLPHPVEWNAAGCVIVIATRGA